MCTLKKLYNPYSGFTHYRNYRAFKAFNQAVLKRFVHILFTFVLSFRRCVIFALAIDERKLQV
ncbi:protein of unknown function [Streptococcus thermophilus]|nr:protein of unknown function [Streptococcus thermophilus]CAD0150211.1 protein of unknown function [Streptococcus thermophilus]